MKFLAILEAQEEARLIVGNIVLRVSTRHIRKCLARWIQWWNETVDDWSKNELIQWFCRACFEITPAAYAAGLLLRQIREARISSVGHRDSVLTTLGTAA
jgi:hypothetical protein